MEKLTGVNSVDKIIFELANHATGVRENIILDIRPYDRKIGGFNYDKAVKWFQKNRENNAIAAKAYKAWINNKMKFKTA